MVGVGEVSGAGTVMVVDVTTRCVDIVDGNDECDDDDDDDEDDGVALDDTDDEECEEVVLVTVLEPERLVRALVDERDDDGEDEDDDDVDGNGVLEDRDALVESDEMDDVGAVDVVDRAVEMVVGAAVLLVLGATLVLDDDVDVAVGRGAPPLPPTVPPVNGEPGDR